MSKSFSHLAYGAAACALSVGLLQFYPLPETARADSAVQFAAADTVLEGHNAVADGSTGITDALDADKPAKRRFDMSDVQSVRMRVWGSPDLNGDYSIEADSTMSLPGVGRIEVGSMSPGDLEKVISEKLSAFSRRDLTVSLEVSRYRSYYIVGQIAEPGAIEWRPGLKVIQAISLAGGVTRPTSAADPVLRDQAQMQLKFALAQLARLKAEKDGKSTVETSQQIASLMLNMPAQQQSIAGFMQQQNATLDEQKAIIQNQLAGLERDKEGAQRELQSATTQEEAIGKQVEIAKTQLEGLENLNDKNLISKTRLLAQRSDLISAQVRLAEARSIVERARGRIGTLERQAVALQQERRAVLNDRIEVLEGEVAQLETSLGSSGVRSPMNLRYHITREGKGEMSTVTAAVDTEVMPGDVVIVSSGAAEPVATSDAGDGLERRVDTQAILEASAALSSGRGSAGVRLPSSLRAMADRIER